MLAEVDSFTEEHLKKHGNPGSGKTSYLSSSTYEEVVNIMAQKCRDQLSSKLSIAKYFSIIVDSSPDIAHVDQLSVVLRYVQENGEPSEVFLTFTPNVGHKGEEMFDAIKDTLKEFNLDIRDCRGQSYDNATNMSGCYKGLQARIKAINEFAKFVPCSAHSLNLVGDAAASCCSESVNYFAFLQGLYNFFSASPNRWDKLKVNKAPSTPKSLSITRWSRRDDACKSLLKSWPVFRDTLESISYDALEKPLVRAEAKGLLRHMNKFETAFMTVFWNSVLNRINTVSKKLQDTDADIRLVIDLYKSLPEYLAEARENFATYEKNATHLMGEQAPAVTRARKRKRHFDESESDEEELTSSSALEKNVFWKIIDHLIAELNRRNVIYDEVFRVFNVLHKFRDLSAEETRSGATLLCEAYPLDISTDVVEEILLFKEYASVADRAQLNINNMCAWIRGNNLVEIFPNLDIALRIYKTMGVSNCSAERSFSCLKRVKSFLRSSMTERRLNDLAILTIESDLLEKVSSETVIKEFCDKKLRRQRG